MYKFKKLVIYLILLLILEAIIIYIGYKNNITFKHKIKNSNVLILKFIESKKNICYHFTYEVCKIEYRNKLQISNF